MPSHPHPAGHIQVARLTRTQRRLLDIIFQRDVDDVAVTASYLAILLRVPRDQVVTELEVLANRRLIRRIAGTPTAVRLTEMGRRLDQRP